MTGEELVKLISDNPYLMRADVKAVILELLKRNLINPSALIDAQMEIMADRVYRLRCHYEDSVVSTMQLFGGNYKGKDFEEAKKRLFYNTSFSKSFPGMSATPPLTEEEKKYWSDFFRNIYGFRPEEE